jgi:hypothetical protein
MAAESGDVLANFLFRIDESRWLVQAALQSLFSRRSTPGTFPRKMPTEGTAPGPGAQYREFALHVLREYAETLRPVFDLLDRALADYLLVVSLRAAQDEHLLNYDLPLELGPRSGILADLVRPLTRHGTFYRVDYRTHIPATLRAYHLVAEAGTGLAIDYMHLTSNQDHEAVQTLATDLTQIAESAADPSTSLSAAKERSIELELQSQLRGLSELVRLRKWEADGAKIAWPSSELEDTESLCWAAMSGEIPAAQGKQHAPLLYHPLVTPGSLKGAATEIKEMQIGLDLTVANTGSGPLAHSYWRSSRAPKSSTLTDVRSTIILRNDSQTRPYPIIAYILTLMLMTYVTAAFLFRSVFPFTPNADIVTKGNNDAVVAVLLLVPGFLYSRLNLPQRGTISSRVRLMPRYCAYLTILISAVLASAVAADIEADALKIVFLSGLAGYVLLATLLFLSGLPSGVELVGGTAPRWARSGPSGKAIPPGADMVLRSSGLKGG